MPDLLTTSTQETWLWIGTAGMALGAVAILVLGRGLGKHSHHAVASFFVCAIAASFYLLMAQGQGDLIVTAKDVALTPDGLAADVESRLIYFARYLDWMFTTPLLLIGLLGIGMAALNTAGEEARQRTGLLAGVIGADIMMIVTGLFGALSLDTTHKYIWFTVSCVFFLAVLYVVWGPVRASAKAQGADVAALYDKLLFILTGLWVIYPVLWLLGTEGSSTISLDSEVAIFAVIDLLAKVGFGLVLVIGVKRLASRGSAGQETSKPATIAD